MSKFKKISSLVLAALIVFSTAGCSTNHEEEQKEFDAFIEKRICGSNGIRLYNHARILGTA